MRVRWTDWRAGRCCSVCARVVCAELSTLWRVRRTIHAMLAERGYLLTQDDMNMTMDDFKATFGDNPPSVDNAIHSRARCAAGCFLAHPPRVSVASQAACARRHHPTRLRTPHLNESEYTRGRFR